jgi:hypothetical protein
MMHHVDPVVHPVDEFLASLDPPVKPEDDRKKPIGNPYTK